MNDNKEINHGNLQVMRCLLCYNSPMHVPNPNTKKEKKIIAYYKTYGITTFKKNVHGNHVIIIIRKCVLVHYGFH